MDNIDVAAATRRGIVVLNTPAGNTVSTAELSMCVAPSFGLRLGPPLIRLRRTMLLSLMRHIAPACSAVRAGHWEDREQFRGSELAGKTLAIVGLGRIGLEVSERASESGCAGRGRAACNIPTLNR